MIFNKHSDLQGRHAFLSPSNYHWLNYDDQKIAAKFSSWASARRGTDLHALAHEAIRLGVDLGPGNLALATYVADALDFNMVCEQALYYSDNCFGTADTISLSDGLLRIHDLKTGIVATSFHQLEVYAAIFCLEYGYSAFELEFELRIYQRDEVRVHVPYSERIAEIMETIVRFDKQVEDLKASDRF
jgi:hypothetical protein